MTKKQFEGALVMELIESGRATEHYFQHGGKRIFRINLVTRRGIELESVGKDWGEVLSKLPGWIKREG